MRNQAQTETHIDLENIFSALQQSHKLTSGPNTCSEAISETMQELDLNE